MFMEYHNHYQWQTVCSFCFRCSEACIPCHLVHVYSQTIPLRAMGYTSSLLAPKHALIAGVYFCVTPPHTHIGRPKSTYLKSVQRILLSQYCRVTMPVSLPVDRRVCDPMT